MDDETFLLEYCMCWLNVGCDNTKVPQSFCTNVSRVDFKAESCRRCASLREMTSTELSVKTGEAFDGLAEDLLPPPGLVVPLGEMKDLSAQRLITFVVAARAMSQFEVDCLETLAPSECQQFLVSRAAWARKSFARNMRIFDDVFMKHSENAIGQQRIRTRGLGALDPRRLETWEHKETLLFEIFGTVALAGVHGDAAGY